MISKFSHVARLEGIECSIVLDASQITSADTKYRAACILEILTHLRPALKGVSVQHENPFLKNATPEELKRLQKLRGKMMRGVSDRSTTAIKLMTTVRKTFMWSFLERLREFYLPDLLSMDERKVLDNSLTAFELRKYFEQPTFRSRGLARLPLIKSLKNTNPEEGTTTFILNPSGLLKFPDIELFYEDLADSFRKDESFHVLIRPLIKITTPKDVNPEHCPPIESVKLMNFLLGQLFNPYIQRI